MSFRLTGRLGDEWQAPDQNVLFDLTYSEENGWSDPDSPVLMVLAAVFPESGRVWWKPIPQAEMLIEPTLFGEESRVASSVLGVLADYTTTYEVTFSEVPDTLPSDVAVY